MLPSPGNQRVVPKFKALDANEIKGDLKFKLKVCHALAIHWIYLILEHPEPSIVLIWLFGPHLSQGQGCEPKNTLTANNLEFDKSLSAWL